MGARAPPPRAGHQDAPIHQGRPHAAHRDPRRRRREAGRRDMAVPPRGRQDPAPRRMSRAALVFIFLVGCQSPGKDPMSAAQELRAICDDCWESTMVENPTYATYLGDFRFNDKLSDISETGRSRRHALNEGFLDRLKKLDLDALPENDRVTADILRLQLEQSLEEDQHKFWQWDVDQMNGPQADFPQLLNFHPLTDEKGLAARFRAFGTYMDQYLDNLRVGVREGRVAMRAAVERVIGQLKGLLATPEDKSPFA